MLRNAPFVPFEGPASSGDAAMQRQWRKLLRLSSLADASERFLVASGFDRGPWIAVAFLAGIASWFMLDGPSEWISAFLALLVIALLARLCWQERDDRQAILLAVNALTATMVLGLAVVWARSELVGAEPIDRPAFVRIEGRVLERVEQPAQDRVRLVLATREPGTGRAIKVRLNVERKLDRAELAEGALIGVNARLMPPAPPALPGAYNFARAAWFDGLAATGSATGDLRIIERGEAKSSIAQVQRRLSAHVRSRLDGTPGAIASALASGDRGAIAKEDEEAMRSAGLTHLLSISGLHVSALVGAVYFLAIRLLALWPWLALRVRLPLVAAGAGALAGVGYTLLTGSEVPTIRSCIGALLVLGALALGREPLSLRMLAVAVIMVLLLWPEALVSPGFQMSFASVLAIISLHASRLSTSFLAHREHESGLSRMGRRAVMLLVTGVVIELALTPIALFHFHRAGVYGAMANVLAIPLVTFATMPLVALALLLDLFGIGDAAWWLVGKSIELLLWLAHWVASQPGAVRSLPAMSGTVFSLFMAGGLWLALWRGGVRLAALPVIILASIAAMATPQPDILVMADGAQVGVVDEEGSVISLRDSSSGFVRDNLMELSGSMVEPVLISTSPKARCSADFCSVTLVRQGRPWHILMARNRMRVEERALHAACERSDIVIAARWLPQSCKPRWLKLDRDYLSREGGVAISLAAQSVRTVAQGEGRHGWWRPQVR
jgi:competence protein ComEC